MYPEGHVQLKAGKEASLAFLGFSSGGPLRLGARGAAVRPRCCEEKMLYELERGVEVRALPRSISSAV